MKIPSEEPVTTEKVTEKFYIQCERCKISSNTKGRMCPCPRGGCEAKVMGTIYTKTIKTTKFIPEKDEEKQWIIW